MKLIDETASKLWSRDVVEYLEKISAQSVQSFPILRLGRRRKNNNNNNKHTNKCKCLDHLSLLRSGQGIQKVLLRCSPEISVAHSLGLDSPKQMPVIKNENSTAARRKRETRNIQKFGKYAWTIPIKQIRTPDPISVGFRPNLKIIQIILQPIAYKRIIVRHWGPM